ncbi:MAG: YeeE/YedE thiosulfate transporter family protein [Salinisphaeraceae bacterium]|uniref:YeeE/YedE thiosulfate transporter family protein n=1 Tax=Spectribacter acetivorans TaxID=3075603 RepID=A0ABU3B6L0_9GAMM|nr:YeeE/YedE thiosulfate transporter family protein [Salinisphaera sp. P385]MDT0617760.1 YeeE/YedE thiosulfate transporter family protein [Salinisphaera sp. P385]
MQTAPKPYWNPYIAGGLLGLGLLLTFVLTGHGLGASGATTAIAAKTSQTVAGNAAESNAYFGRMLSDGYNPLNFWITWQLIGLAVGALIGALTAGRFRLQFGGPDKLGRAKRGGLALLGGMLAGFGARLSLGCTSGLGLSGSATLGVAGFLFLIGFFATGAGVGLFMKRYWA